MNSFYLQSPGHLVPFDVPEPQPGPLEVRVKIAYVGVCGSDIEVFKGHRRPEFLTDPVMLGHEPSGIIDCVGENVSGLRVGDRVTTVGIWGAYTDFLVCRPENCLRLLPEIPLIDGSLIEVLPGIIASTAHTGITRAHDVAVVGTGLSGLLLVRLAHLQGCRRLIAIDIFDEKLELAREFGATHTINAARQDVREAILDITGDGVDYSLMATLDGNDVPRALDFTRFAGKIVLYGGIGPCDGIDFFKQHRKGISILKETIAFNGHIKKRRLWREAMQLVADGLLNTRRLRTHILPMRELPHALELRATPRGDVLHVLLENDWAREKRERGEEF